MPNWCENEIKITANSEKELGEFVAYVRDNNSLFSFNKILPVQDEVTKVDVWGTKWSVQDVDYVWESLVTANYFFETAWTPPYGIYTALQKQFPDIDICWFYKEEGNRIAGYMNNEKEKENGSIKVS